MSQLTTSSLSFEHNCFKQEELERMCGPEAVANLG